MNLQELFPPGHLLVGLGSMDKWAAIERIFAHLAEASGVPEGDRSGLLEAVQQRERSMSTGMERGLAIPHAAVDELDEVLACLAVAPGGLNFESIDASPTRIVVLLLIPRAKKLLHIRTLADIARVLSSEQVRDSLLAAGTPEEAWHALGETTGS